MRRKFSFRVGSGIGVAAVAAIVSASQPAAQAYVVGPGQGVTSLFLQNFSGATSDPYVDYNAISGQTVGSHGGSTQLLTNFDGVSGQNAVEFTDTAGNGSGGYSNLGSTFYYNVTSANGATLLNAINAILTSPSGTTGQFIFQYDIQRTQASNVPVYGSDDGYIQFSPNDGNPPSTYTGRDRIPTGQT